MHDRISISRRRLVAASLATPLLGGVLGSRLALADEASLAAAAKREGRVTFYSVVPQAVAQPMIDGFQRKYGIELDYQRLTTGPLVQRYVAELQAGNVVADAIAVTDNFFFDDATAKGWLAPIADVPAAAGYPAQFLDKASATVQVLPHELSYNTTLVKQAPKSWEVLIDPQYKGKITLVDPRNGFFTTVFFYALRQKFGNDFLKALLRQEPTLVQSAVLGVQQMAAGATTFCAPAYPNLIPDLKAKGAPIDIVAVEPTIASGVYLGVSAKAPHPSGARLLANYLMTAEGQGPYNKDSVAPLGTLPGTLPLPRIDAADLKAAQAAQKDIFAALGVQ